MITNGRRDLTDIGAYRTHTEPMQVVSGRLDRPIVHFEASSSNEIPREMKSSKTRKPSTGGMTSYCPKISKKLSFSLKGSM